MENIFNLMKHSSLEKRLQDDNKEKGLSSSEPKTFNKMLEDVRGNSSDQILQKRLAKTYKDDNTPRVTEKKLENKSEIGLKTRGDFDPTHPMDMHENINKLKASKNPLTVAKERFIDKEDGKDLEIEEKNIVSGKPKSQLLSNYKNRKEYNKAMSSYYSDAKKAILSEDAKLYAIYRDAYSKSNDLSKEHLAAIDIINNNKKDILNKLSQVNPYDGFHEDFEDEQTPVERLGDLYEDEDYLSLIMNDQDPNKSNNNLGENDEWLDSKIIEKKDNENKK